MKTNDYTEEELELLEAMENQPLISVPNLAREIEQLKTSVKTKLSKRKSINLRLLENDLQRIKTEAIKEGIPYQTLISSILHKYVQGDLAGSLSPARCFSWFPRAPWGPRQPALRAATKRSAPQLHSHAARGNEENPVSLQKSTKIIAWRRRRAVSRQQTAMPNGTPKLPFWWIADERSEYSKTSVDLSVNMTPIIKCSLTGTYDAHTMCA